MANSAVPAVAQAPSRDETQLYSRIGWRIFPLVLLGYIFAYLDRINIGFAALHMKADLGFTDAVYGLGAGIFFASYLAFEVPSNLLLQRIGARLTLARIMICWGITSSCMMFVRTPAMFYTLRVLLGMFEAGFTPGVVFYLTLWYPKARLARVTALFLSGGVLAGLMGSPLSGLIVDSMAGFHGMRGWQWLFLLEGVPSVLLGLACLLWLPNGPHEARWLSDDERQSVLEGASRESHGQRSGFSGALRDFNVYAIALAWFTVICGTYVISFWLPLMLRHAGLRTASQIGLWSTIPYGLGAIGMLMLSLHSDRTLERRWHAAGCALAGAAALGSLPFVWSSFPLALASLSVATISVFGAMPILFSVPMTLLPRSSAPGGIALINSIGQTGGFLSPFVVGWVKTYTGSFDFGLYFMALLLALGACVILFVVRTTPQVPRESADESAPAMPASRPGAESEKSA
ncbi:MFS transporter [Paraburkholderia silviterrae]|uniref:MFS transporter n=1 Tax=Paraburkholderia silviterrae TaxID=2528715 RepID=A0A4R5M2V8_9BURK|nr:MFS transporter [Paraburkholderia silviterrae]TDG19952.1 MFS transporter [Paraburkholderia silviterrae]